MGLWNRVHIDFLQGRGQTYLLRQAIHSKENCIMVVIAEVLFIKVTLLSLLQFCYLSDTVLPPPKM